MAGWFELSKSSDGQFRFVLKAGNAEIMSGSELHKAKASAENGIASVQGNCTNDERYERKVAANIKSHFNLKASTAKSFSAARCTSPKPRATKASKASKPTASAPPSKT